MQYPEEFAKHVRALFGDDDRIIHALNTGSPWLGRYLDDARYGGIDVDTVLVATSLEKLKEKALRMKMISEAYSEWLAIAAWNRKEGEKND